MNDWIFDIVYPINRWLHLVGTTLILGGTLFFELVLPAAIEDLKREQQLYVFARARWVFRWVVWIGVLGLLVSGSADLMRQWQLYHTDEFIYVWRWAIAHVAFGLVAMLIALLLTIGNRPPENPVLWMRLNVVVLITVIFLASATRHFQLDLSERRGRPPRLPEREPEPMLDPEAAATSPSSRSSDGAP